MRSFISIAFALVALCGCAASSVRIPEEDLRSRPLYYPEFYQYLQTRTHAPVSQIRFQRDTIGSKLFVTFFFRKRNEPAHRTLIVTRDGIKEVPGYEIVWYDDHEDPVFRLEGGKQWYEDDGRFLSKFDDANYVFKNGSLIPFEAIWAEIRGVLGGDFVMLKFRDKPAWIVSSPANPRQTLLELPSALDYPERAYATADSLIIFGPWRPVQSGPVKCLIYQKSSNGYHLSKEISMSWGGTVYDFNEKTGDALISGTGQFAGYYRFNITTKRRTRLGSAPSDNVLFLKDDVIRTLDAAINASKSEADKH